ncbi:hypothetical protein BJX62DRAFT_228928 [Aspergillus germanicus]
MAPNSLFILTLTLSLFTTSLAVRGYSRRDDTPQLPFDPNTTPYCTSWVDNDGSSSCSDILSDWIISLEDFRRWNPSITAACGGLETGKSYCVEAWGEPVPTTTSGTTTAAPTTSTTRTTTTTTTTTKTGNAPSPTQPGQIERCNRWDLVQAGDTCNVYIEKYPGLSLTNLVEWNPAIGSQCQNLWVETYLCTGVEGWSAPTTTTTTTTTSPPGNGIPTPTPTQPGMVSDCNGFHEVVSGDTCASIAQAAGISLSWFTAWNSGVGSGCTSLWLGYYVCTSRAGATATMTTTTTAGNGIATPTPTLPGMVANCDAFYLVKAGDGCAAIASSKGISLSQLYAWNTNLGTMCTGLWAEYYVCVSIIGVAPTTTTKTTTRTTTTTTTTQGNGVATPTPIQPGMTTSCRTFHKVVPGDQCGTIASKAGITLANFLRWNPGVGGSGCSSLWLGYYVCIAVL